MKECRKQHPDATEEEIAHFIHEKAAPIKAGKRVQNPIGFLLTAVPKCFSGEAFRQYREQQRQAAAPASDAPLREFAPLEERIDDREKSLKSDALSDQVRKLWTEELQELYAQRDHDAKKSKAAGGSS